MNDLKINLVTELKVKYVPKRGRKPVGEILTSIDAFKIIYPLFNPDTIRLQEQFVVIYLNNASAVIGYFSCSIGGTTGTCVDNKIILSIALRCVARSMIIAHNHPSGKIVPSASDKKVTYSLKQAAEYLGVNLIDHLILSGDNNYYSFADHGIM